MRIYSTHKSNDRNSFTVKTVPCFYMPHIESNAEVRAVVDVRHGAASFPFAVALHAALPNADALLRRAQRAGLETAFLAPETPGQSARFRLRWFSLHSEMQLCGTGTLAAALFLFHGPLQGERAVTFSTAGGGLRARSTGRGRAAIRLPRYALRSYAPSPALLEGLGVAASSLRALVSQEAQTVVLVLPERRCVERLQPDFAALKEVREQHVGAVIATAPGRDAAHFVFRYFTPWYGKDESVMASSALSLLAPYWAAQLGASTLRARQRSSRDVSFSMKVEEEGLWLSGRGAPREAAAGRMED